MKKYYLAAVCAAVFLAACQRHSIPVISSRTVDPPAPVSVKPEIKADPVAGKTLFENRCSKCHVLPDPGQFSQQRWDGILLRMIPKAKLNDAEAEALRIYISSVAGS